MHRRTLRVAAIAVALVVVAGACQSDGDDDGADATIAGTPIEEPGAVTDESDESTTATSESTATAGDDTVGEPDDPTDPTLGSLVLEPADEKNTPPTVLLGEPATETIYEVGSVDAGLTSFVDAATEHLADRLDVAPESIEVLTAVLVTWPDSALGCRQPDRVYAPVLTDGSVIELGAGGLVYRYHSGGDRAPFPCDLPLDPVPPPLS